MRNINLTLHVIIGADSKSILGGWAKSTFEDFLRVENMSSPTQNMYWGQRLGGGRLPPSPTLGSAAMHLILYDMVFIRIT